MFKKIIYTLLFSSVALFALESGENISKEVQEQLKLEENKVYVIDFFASWCKSCKKELPLVLNLYNDKVVEVIGVNVDKKKEDGEKFVKDLNLSFHVVYDTDKKLVETFDPLGFPAIYYVKDGKVLHVIFGAVKNIDEVIKEDIKSIK